MQAGTVETLTVVCINWCNYLGRGQEYVEKLERAVARNLTIPHRFVCLTEKDLGTDLKGWWVKMKLGTPGLFSGPVMYLDLDVVVTQNIDVLPKIAASDRTKVWMRDDFGYSIVRPRVGIGTDTARLLGGPGCCNSSVMLWHGDAPWWDKWQSGKDAYMAEMHGDQNVITQILWPDRIGLLPNTEIGSYKYNVCNGDKPYPLTVFHGTPKPHDIGAKWARECWS